MLFIGKDNAMKPEFIGSLVIGLTALIGLISALNNYVGKPVNELNSSIKALNVRIENLAADVTCVETAVKEQEMHDRASHSRMWTKHNEHDSRLNDHEKRIGRLEHIDNGGRKNEN